MPKKLLGVAEFLVMAQVIERDARLIDQVLLFGRGSRRAGIEEGKTHRRERGNRKNSHDGIFLSIEWGEIPISVSVTRLGSTVFHS